MAGWPSTSAAFTTPYPARSTWTRAPRSWGCRSGGRTRWTSSTPSVTAVSRRSISRPPCPASTTSSSNERQRPSDADHLVDRAEQVAQRTHARARIVAPFDADLDDAVAEAGGQRQDLEVEGPAVHGRSPEEIARGGRDERLAAAVSVGDPGHQRSLHDEVGEAAPEAPPPRLIGPAALEVAGADRDRRFAAPDRREQLGDLRYGRRAVGVIHDDDGAAGGVHAGAHGVTLAAVGAALDEAQPRGPLGHAPAECRRAVGGTVVDYDDLPAPRRGGQIGGAAL